MHTLDTLLSRRTIHDFRPDAIPEPALWRALEAAHHAPCHKLTWPWRFTRLGPEVRAEVVELAVAIKCGEKAPDAERAAKVRKKFQAPEILVVSQVLAEDLGRREEDYAAVSCAVQNLMLALWAQGIGSKWSTGKVTTHARTYELAGIEAARERVVGFVWAGFAEVTPQIERPPLEGFVRQTP